MAWTEADFDRYSDQDGDEFELSTSLLDALQTGLSEGWKSGPTNSLDNWLISKSGKQYMSPVEANEKYNLKNTDYAFKDGDQLISDEHAENVLRENLYRRSNEVTMERVQQDYGLIGSATNFAGNIGAGISDPTNLLVSVGTSLALAKGVTKFGTVAMKEVVRGKTVGDAFAREMVLSTADSVLIDQALVPIGEDAVNREVDLTTRVTNFVGSALIGGVLGTAMEVPAIRKAQIVVKHNIKQHGSKADELLEKSHNHATLNVANNKNPNSDFELEKMELEVYRDRPDQTSYMYGELDSNDVYETDFFLGRYLDEDDFDIISGQGTGTLVLTDKRNVAHNRVHPIDNSRSGEIFSTRISKKSRVLTYDEFDIFKAEIRESIKNLYDSAPNTNKETRATFLNRLNREIDDSGSFNDFKDAMDFVLSQDEADLHNIGDIDDFFNKAIHDIGYNGYTAKGESLTLGNSEHNLLVLFKPEVFTPELKPKKSLYVNRGNVKPRNGMTASTDGFGIYYNRDMFDRPVMGATDEFNPEHINANDYLQPIKDLEKAELGRMNDPKEDIDYDGKASSVGKEAPEAMTKEEYSSTQALLDSEDETYIKDVAGESEEYAYMNKTDEELEGIYNDTLDCMIGED